MMYYRQNRGPRNPRNPNDPQGGNSQGNADNAGNRSDSGNSGYGGNRDNRGNDNRGNDNRDNRPYNRDSRPGYGNRDSRPGYGNPRPPSDRGYGNRDSRPPSDRPYGNRDSRPYNDRPGYGNRDSRPPSDRPYGNRDSRPYNDRPGYGNRDSRPPSDRPYGNRDSRPGYGRDSRPYGDRPSRPYGDRDARPYNDRPRRPYGDRPSRPYGDRDRRGGDRRPSHGPVKDNRISLPRTIARLGFTSRNLAIDIIKEGRVRVDDRVVSNPSVRLTPHRNLIYIDDVCINQRRPRTYILMHKPKGLVTSREEGLGRKTIYSVLPNRMEWYFPVGRLDKNTSGLLILTNDRHLANPQTSPFLAVQKSFMVKLNKPMSAEDVEKLNAGIALPGGGTFKPAMAAHVRDNKHTCWVEVTLVEGRNVSIRSAFKVLGFEVLTLMRTKVGNIELGALPIGSWKELSHDEIAVLYGGTLPEHFGTPPTEEETKIASGEIEVMSSNSKKRAARAAAGQPHNVDEHRGEE